MQDIIVEVITGIGVAVVGAVSLWVGKWVNSLLEMKAKREGDSILWDMLFAAANGVMEEVEDTAKDFGEQDALRYLKEIGKPYARRMIGRELTEEEWDALVQGVIRSAREGWRSVRYGNG